MLESSLRSDWHYYGYTNDLKFRFKTHSLGLVKSTSAYLPLKLKYYEAYDNENLARAREATLKRSHSATKALYARIYI
jgi:predicted GIY-YIG superfamily endonuclease